MRLSDEFSRAFGMRVELLPGPAEVHRQRDELLLGAVVQVTFDAAALGVGRVNDAGAAVSVSWET